jgi:hypothetical protein
MTRTLADKAVAQLAQLNASGRQILWQTPAHGFECGGVESRFLGVVCSPGKVMLPSEATTR